MASVKQLMAKFQAKPAAGGALTPVSFEEQMKQVRQKELEEIRLAREKAKLYNATLRAKTIQMAKEQSVRTRGLVSPRTSGRAFNFDGSANPNFSIPEEDTVRSINDALNEIAIGSNGSVIGHVDKIGNTPSITEGGGLVEQEGFSTAPRLSEMDRTEESFEGKTEEKKDVLTEMSCPPTNISPRLSQLTGTQRLSGGFKEVAKADPMTLPPAEAISNSIRTSGNKNAMKTFMSVQSMADVHIPPQSQSKIPDRKDSDLGSVSSVAVIPDGGFEEIHEAVRFNRPSVSDLLLRPTLGERNYSVTSVGPMVEAPSEEPCRLSPGVDIRTVLQTFYQTYAPEKLEDLDLVLRHFRGRTEALLFTLECKYFVSISPDGLVTPFRPSEAPPDAEKIEDERQAARRSTMLSTATDMTDFTTDSYKGYIPADMRDGGLPSTLANSWAVRPKHDTGKRDRKTALMMKKVGSDLL